MLKLGVHVHWREHRGYCQLIDIQLFGVYVKI